MPFRALVLLVCLAAPGAGLSGQRPDSSPASLLVRGVTLIDGNGGPPRPATDVFVRDRRIVSIGAPTAETANVTIDGNGLLLLPGLIDPHVHLSGMSWTERAAQLARVLEGGVTAIYDVASDLRNTSDLARAALVGEIDSPAIFYTALCGALDADTVRRIGEEATRRNVRLIAHSTVFPAKPSDLVAAGVKYLAHSAYLVWEGLPPSADFAKRARGDFASVPPDGPVMTGSCSR